MKLINRHRLAEKLGMTPSAVSAQVSRRNWDAVPRPGKIGGVYKWVEEDVDDWIQDKFSESCGDFTLEVPPKRRRGRPCKKR